MTQHDKSASYQSIFKVISLLGTASVLSVLFGLLRMKFAAVLLGPVGVGIIGLLQNISGIATTLGDMGMRQSGAREISRARAAEEPDRIEQVRETLGWMGVCLALIVSLFFFIFRDEIATHLLAQPDLSDEVGWLTVAVVATILAAALTAILNGYQRISEIGRITVLSALASCILSVGSLWLWGERAIPVVVAAAPVTLLCYSLWYVARIGALPRWTSPTAVHFATAARMMKLGVFVMLSALTLSAAEFLVRLSIQRELGLFEVGLFSAAWTIGVYYINFLMVATSTEFFPRISSQIDDPDSLNAAINLQMQSLCIASVPMVIALTAFCPLVLKILYSEEFTAGTSLVRLMAIGDVFRLSVYPLGFVLLAAAHGRAYFLLKLFEALGFAALSALLLPRFGLEGVGAAHITTFFLLFLLYQLLLNRYLQFRLAPRSMAAVALLAAMAVALSALVVVSELVAGLTGAALTIGWGILVLRLLKKTRTGQAG